MPPRGGQRGVGTSTLQLQDHGGVEATPTPAPRGRVPGHSHRHQEDPTAEPNAMAGPSRPNPPVAAARANRATSHHSSSSSSHSEQHSRPGTPPSPSPPTDSSSGEDEELNDVFNSPLTPRRLSPPASPTRAAREERAQGTPRFGRRSRVAAVARDGPAGNKTQHKALDVWRFFTAIHTHNYCVFCE